MPLPGFLLLSLIPGGLMIAAFQHIRRTQPDEQTPRRLFYLMLASIVALLAVLTVLDYQQTSSMIGLVIIPVLTGLIPISYLYWRDTPQLHNREITRILLIFVPVVVILAWWYTRTVATILPFMAASAVIILLIWRAWTRRQWLAWAGLALLFAAMAIELIVPGAVASTWPTAFQTALSVITTMIWPVVTVALAGRLALATVTHSLKRRQLVMDWLVVAAMFGLLVVLLAEQSLIDTATDGLAVVMMLMMLSIPSLAVTLVLAWKLETRRWRTSVIFAVALMAFTALAFGGVTRLDPPQVTAERAATINQAVQNYYADNGEYPADLSALFPRYLLVIPEPVLFHNQSWCYESGGDYYRFGYVYRRYFSVPSSQITVQVAGEGGQLPAESWTCDSLLTAYRERYGAPDMGYQPASGRG